MGFITFLLVISPMKTLDLNQITVEPSKSATPDLLSIAPIVSTDHVANCDGYTAGY